MSYRFIKYPTYIVTVQHDDGISHLKVVAQNITAAYRIVTASENCPGSAITRIRQA